MFRPGFLIIRALKYILFFAYIKAVCNQKGCNCVFVYSFFNGFCQLVKALI